MEKINFKDGQLVKGSHVIINGVEYQVIDAVYQGDTPLSAFVLNKLQDNIETHLYRADIKANIAAGGEVILPCYYKVGTDCLKVQYETETLIKATDNDTQGHYYEVGAVNSISNKIKITSDWSLEVGDVLIFIVQGVYSA